MDSFFTPIIRLSNSGKKLNRNNIFLKLESTHPISHTFKDRGARSVLENMKQAKKDLVLAATCSNMGVAISGMAAKFGKRSLIVISSSAPVGLINMMQTFSHKSIVLEGGFDEVDRFIGQISLKFPDIPCVNTNYDSCFFKGYYSLMDELYHQLNSEKTYHIVVPTADGTLISSLYKRYKELIKIGTMPKLIFHIAQPEGCAPLVEALQNNQKLKPLYYSFTSVIPLNVKAPTRYGDNAIVAVKESGGTGIKVDENKIMFFQKQLTEDEGIFSDSVGGVLFGAIYQLSKTVASDEAILGIYTGNGLVYSCEGDHKSILSMSIKDAQKEIDKFITGEKDV